MTQSPPESLNARIAKLPPACRDDVTKLIERLEKFATRPADGKPSTFLSHVAKHVREANDYKAKLKNQSAFLSSDWESLQTGGFWFQEIVHALHECQKFEALVFERDDFRSLWMSFELGVAMGTAAKAQKSDAQIASDVNVVFPREKLEPPVDRICPIGDWKHSAQSGCHVEPSQSSRFYLSHTLPGANFAGQFAECIRHMDPHKRHVATRSEHWKLPGSKCLNSVRAIQAREEFIALIDVGCDGAGGKFDANSPWLNFEVGVAIGLRKQPLIFIHEYYLDKGAVGFPLKAISLLRTGDPNRRDRTFEGLGLSLTGMLGNLDWLFMQRNRETAPTNKRPVDRTLPPKPPADPQNIEVSEDKDWNRRALSCGNDAPD